MQRDKFDEKQPVLRPARRRGKIDCAGLPAKAGLTKHEARLFDDGSLALPFSLLLYPRKQTHGSTQKQPLPHFQAETVANITA